jgi:hypothetical protein
MAMQNFDPNRRAAEKEASRRSDAYALFSGSKSQAQLIRENEPLRNLGRSARVSMRSGRELI